MKNYVFFGLRQVGGSINLSPHCFAEFMVWLLLFGSKLKSNTGLLRGDIPSGGRFLKNTTNSRIHPVPSALKDLSSPGVAVNEPMVAAHIVLTCEGGVGYFI